MIDENGIPMPAGCQYIPSRLSYPAVVRMGTGKPLERKLQPGDEDEIEAIRRRME